MAEIESKIQDPKGLKKTNRSSQKKKASKSSNKKSSHKKKKTSAAEKTTPTTSSPSNELKQSLPPAHRKKRKSKTSKTHKKSNAQSKSTKEIEQTNAENTNEQNKLDLQNNGNDPATSVNLVVLDSSVSPTPSSLLLGGELRPTCRCIVSDSLTEISEFYLKREHAESASNALSPRTSASQSH